MRCSVQRRKRVPALEFSPYFSNATIEGQLLALMSGREIPLRGVPVLEEVP